MDLSMLVWASIALIGSVQALRSKNCLPGNKHKQAPSAEHAEFSACKAYKNNSCCRASFTELLADSPVRRVEDFSWTPCGGNLTARCEAFMIKIECFYRCSPNVWFWRNPAYQSAFIDAPLCSTFCESWFDACKNDLTCGKNWQKDFNFTTQPSTCLTSSACKNMSEVYIDAKGMCENLWGKSFTYKQSEKKHDCLNLDIEGNRNPNDMVVMNYLFGAKSHKSSTSGVPAPRNGNIITAFTGFISAAFTSRLLL